MIKKMWVSPKQKDFDSSILDYWKRQLRGKPGVPMEIRQLMEKDALDAAETAALADYCSKWLT